MASKDCTPQDVVDFAWVGAAMVLIIVALLLLFSYFVIGHLA